MQDYQYQKIKDMFHKIEHYNTAKKIVDSA